MTQQTRTTGRTGQDTGTPVTTPKPPTPNGVRHRPRHTLVPARLQPRWWTSRAALAAAVAALVVLPALAAYLWSSSSPQVWAARAEVLFTGGDTQVAQRAEQQTATQVVVLGSRPVLEPAAEVLGRDVTSLEEALDVEQVEDSEVLRVTVVDPNPDAARRAAQAVVDQYVAMVSGPAGGDAAQLELLQADLTQLDTRFREVNDRLAAIVRPSAPARVLAEQARLENEARVLGQRVADLQDRITGLRLTDLDRSPPSRVLTPAYVLDDPVGPQPWRAAAAAAVVGTVVAALALAVLARRRPGA
jgi:uncharacterized protein involved in exopolysaccharide biosynthesis